MIEFTAAMRLVVKSQTIIVRVGTLRARQCHGQGMRTRKAAMNAPTGSSACMSLRKGSKKQEASGLSVVLSSLFLSILSDETSTKAGEPVLRAGSEA